MAQQYRAEFAVRLEAYGDRPALVDEAGRELSYAALAACADDFANSLGPDKQLILLEAKNDIRTFEVLLGGLRCGHPLILTSPERHKSEEIAQSYGVSVRVGPEGVERLADKAPDLHPDLALLLSTSGTTGATKLVRLSHGNIQANAAAIADYLRLGPNDRAITSLAPHYSYGLSVINSHLLTGAKLILTDHSVVDDRFRALFESQNVTSMAGVPYTYELLERSGFRTWAPETLATLTQAGGRLPPELVERYRRWCEGRGVRFFVMYGQTEATARMSYVPPEMLAGNEATIGRPIPGGELMLVNPDGTFVEHPDVEGELVYRGPNIMLGYAREEADLARGPELDRLETGDLAVRQTNGLFRITGRKSRFVKPYGLRVSLDEVETKLRKRGLVPAVTGTDEFLAIAYVGTERPEQLRADLARELGLPEAVFRVQNVENLPTLPSGKVDYRGILESSSHAVSESIDILDLFLAAFPGKIVQPSDSFVSLAGDSLNYVVLASAIEDRLGYLPPGWERTSIADLSGSDNIDGGSANWLRWLDTEILLRALAICAVVVSHVSDLQVGGGAEALLLLLGFNQARFQFERFKSGRLWLAVRRMAVRILMPYFLLMAAYAATGKPVSGASWLLLSNFEGRFATLLEPYWFIEAIFQSMLILLALSSLRSVQQFASAKPLGFGVTLLGISLLAKLAAGRWLPHEHLLNRTPDQLFYLIALGWCLYFARTQAVKLSLLALSLTLWMIQARLLIVPGWELIGGGSRGFWVVFATLLLLYVPRLPVFSPIRSLVIGVSAASFTIYMLHVFPIWILHEKLAAPQPLAIIVAIATGYVAHFVIAWATHLFPNFRVVKEATGPLPH